MDSTVNPFAAPSPIVAPAVLTNASAVLAMSAMMHRAIVLVRETRIAVAHLEDRVAQARATLRPS
jgi:hypothetical protein